MTKDNKKTIEARNATTLAFAKAAPRGEEPNYVVTETPLFSANWKKPLNRTGSKNFLRDDGKVVSAEIMRGTFERGDGFAVKEGADYQAIAVPYDKPGLRAIFILPAALNVSAQDWLSRQPDTAAWMKPESYVEVSGSFEAPVFTAGLLEKGVVASKDAVLKMEATGSVAAAVTSIRMMRETLADPRKHVDIRLDRSFAYAIQDTKSGALLYLGVVGDPAREWKPPVKKSPALD